VKRWLLPLALVLGLSGVGTTAAFAVRARDEPPVVDAPAEPSAPPAPQPIVVDVVGAIAHPGVVRLPPGSRVLDALLAAGGMTGEADLTALNKAAPLRDGMRIYVPRPGEAVPAGSAAGPAETKVNLNAATAAELDALPGVGPATAAAIVRARATKPFIKVDELQTRGLVSPRAFAELRDLISVR
jgi:competence protein ComEA